MEVIKEGFGLGRGTDVSKVVTEGCWSPAEPTSCIWGPGCEEVLPVCKGKGSDIEEVSTAGLADWR